MGEAIIWTILSQPITSILILVIVGVFVHIRNQGWDYEDIGISYARMRRNLSISDYYTGIFEEKQYWRAVSASLSHISVLHLLFNVSSLWAIGQAEQMGTILYLKYTYLLLVLSMVVVMLMYWLLINRFGREQLRNQIAVGYSCVLFGWMTIMAQISPSRVISFLGLQFPLDLAPFGSLILTQVLVPRASLLGHLSGIVVGYLIAWGVFSWIDGMILAWMCFWSVTAVIASLKANSPFPVNFIQLESEPGYQQAGRSFTVMNGVVVDRP